MTSDSLIAEVRPLLGAEGSTDDEIRRLLLELVAVEGYRAGRWGHRRIGEILGLNWHQTESLLGRHGAFLQYDEGEIEREIETLGRSEAPTG